MSTAYKHCHFIRNDGTLWFLGYNFYGQAGTGASGSPISTITQIGTDTDWQWAGAGGLYASFAVKTDGTLWAVGDNASGQLGLGDTSPRLTFTQVGTDTNWDYVRCGGGFGSTIVARKTDGTIWWWGTLTTHSFGAISSSTVPLQIGTDSDWAAIDAGTYACVGLKTDGTIWWWGNWFSYLQSSTPVQIGSDADWNYVRGGGRALFLLKDTGDLYAIGRNNSWRFSNTYTFNADYTTPILITTDVETLGLSFGDLAYTIVKKAADKRLYAVGEGSNGQMGDSVLGDNPSFALVNDTNEFSLIGGGYWSIWALRSDGRLVTWGSNQEGQRGVGFVGGDYANTFTVGTDTWVHVAGETLPIAPPPPPVYEEKWSNRQPWGFSLSKQFRQPWGERYYADYQFRHPWNELTYTPFDTQFCQPWREYIEKQFRQPWGEQRPFDFQFRQPWSELAYTPFDFQFRQPWREYVEKRIRQPITYAHDTPFDFQFRQPWDELSYAPIDVRIRQPWAEISDTYQAFTGDIYITADGRRVEISEASLTADEDSPYWQASITLSNVSEYGRFPRNTAFTLHFYGTDYSLISDTRNLLREFSADGGLQDSARITALSPLMLKASPRADSLEQIWDAAIMAQTLVEGLIGATTWQTVNWPITANLFGVSGSSPLEAARQVIDAVGAIVLSDPDGSVVVRPRYPVSVPEYEATSPAVTLTAHDIYSADENLSAKDRWNSVAISNVEEIVNQDRLEFVADDANGLKGELRAYPSPWEASVSIRTTRSGVTLSRIGTAGRDVTETIEIVEGRGSVQYPIYTVGGLDYLDNYLGGVSFSGAEITTSIAGYSLLKITYRTRYVAYSARVTREREAQMLLERT